MTGLTGYRKSDIWWSEKILKALRGIRKGPTGDLDKDGTRRGQYAVKVTANRFQRKR